jgi:uncharacterized membrane protein
LKTGNVVHERVRATQRLEMFSDIVIGFSLAEIGINLVVPPHAIEFVTHPAGVFAFIVTFVVVIRFWWVNNQIFEHYFVPNRLMTTLNFIALAALILQVFSLQLYLHFVPLDEGVVASRIYFTFFALSYGMQGLVLGLGLLHRRRELSRQKLRSGLRELFVRTGLVVGCFIGNVTASNDISKVFVQSGRGRQFLVANFPSSIVADGILGILIGLGLWLLIVRLISRRASAVGATPLSIEPGARERAPQAGAHE